jgi:hypothetical protein
MNERDPLIFLNMTDSSFELIALLGISLGKSNALSYNRKSFGEAARKGKSVLS